MTQRPNHSKIAVQLIAVSLVASCANPDAEPKRETETPVAELLGQGEAMVENLCASCHAIGAADESAHPDAPALRDLSSRLNLEDLRGPFSEGIVVGHPDMPEWVFEPHHIDALIYYLESLQTN